MPLDSPVEASASSETVGAMNYFANRLQVHLKKQPNKIFQHARENHRLPPSTSPGSEQPSNYFRDVTASQSGKMRSGGAFEVLPRSTTLRSNSWNGIASADSRSISKLSRVLEDVHVMWMSLSLEDNYESFGVGRGTKTDEARRRFISVRGGEDHLCIPHAGSSVYFAIKSKIRYLGVILSYGAFEMQSAAYRCGQAKAAFGQLRAVLCTGSCLSI